MDQKDALTSAEISTLLGIQFLGNNWIFGNFPGLDVIRGHHWSIFSTCAINGQGLDKVIRL